MYSREPALVREHVSGVRRKLMFRKLQDTMMVQILGPSMVEILIVQVN